MGDAMQLSTHFSLSEFTTSQAASRSGLRNIPNANEVENLRQLCINVLEPLRCEVGPIIVSSGFRSVEVNRAVGGSSSSQHVLGQAADIISPRIRPIDLTHIIAQMRLPFDQLIEEFGEWTHVSYGPRHRQEILQARRVQGKVVYTKRKLA